MMPQQRLTVPARVGYATRQHGGVQVLGLEHTGAPLPSLTDTFAQSRPRGGCALM